MPQFFQENHWTKQDVKVARMEIAASSGKTTAPHLEHPSPPPWTFSPQVLQDHSMPYLFLSFLFLCFSFFKFPFHRHLISKIVERQRVGLDVRGPEKSNSSPTKALNEQIPKISLPSSNFGR